MRKKILITFIFFSVALFFLQSCGIPKMFKWENNNEYYANNNSIKFNMSYMASGETQHLHAKDNFPQMFFFYAIGPTTGLTSSTTQDRMISAFNTFSRSYPSITTNVNDHEPIVSSTVSLTGLPSDDNSTRIGLYEFIDASDTNSRPDFPKGIKSFLPPRLDEYVDENGNLSDSDESIINADYSWLYLDNFDKAITYTASMIPYDDGYAVQLIIYPDGPEENQLTYFLLRNNGETFKTAMSEYINDGSSSSTNTREYKEENDNAISFMSPAIYIFVSCTFAFEGYTTISTIPLHLVGNPIELSSI